MTDEKAAAGELFDDWPDRYDQWFLTPIGRVIKASEAEVLLDLLAPQDGERILDVGCGTGLFTREVFSAARFAAIVGIDLSLPMLRRAVTRNENSLFTPVAANMLHLPFADESFDRVFSMTALEFVADARQAIDELSRVTRSGGTMVITTLNSLSPWAQRRKAKAAAGHSLFANMIFRSPQEMCRLLPGAARVETAVHFAKDEEPQRALALERQGRERNDTTGAMLAIAWHKP